MIHYDEDVIMYNYMKAELLLVRLRFRDYRRLCISR